MSDAQFDGLKTNDASGFGEKKFNNDASSFFGEEVKLEINSKDGSPNSQRTDAVNGQSASHCSSRVSASQRLSAEGININSSIREVMLFLALATSTMQHFAMVILIPFICTYSDSFKSTIKSYEIGIILATATAGELTANRLLEPCISKLGTKWSIQLSFLLMTASSFAFWQVVAKIKNDSEFLVFAFVIRFAFGVGSGLLRSVLMIARAQSKKGMRDLQATDYFK